MSNATPKNASSFTFQHLEMILNAIRFDPRFVGCVDYGSTSEGRGDEWSDLDLAFFVRDEDLDTASIEKAIPPIQYMRLKRCVAGPHVGELRRSMLEAAKLGSEVCQSISDKHGWEWPSELAERVIQLNQR